MQVHGPSQGVDEIHVRLNPGSRGAFAVVEIGSVTIYLETIADADELIKAAATAKDLLIRAATPELDAKLSPPATDARDTDGTPPGHQLPAGVAGWDEPLPDGCDA